MSNASALFRSLIIYSLCLPLAVALGYLLANPLDLTTVTVLGIVLFILLIPLLLRWHHAWLIAGWNMSAVLFFLPGHPSFWIGMAAISFLIGVLQYTINRNLKFLYVPSVTRPLLFLTAVILITARLTGGIGLKVMGSNTYGGRNYVAVFAAVIGYFALTSRQIRPTRVGLFVTLFFLGGITMAIGELPRVLPISANVLFVIFPVFTGGMAAQQSPSAVGPLADTARINGLAMLGLGIFYAMMARYGVRGVFLEPGKFFRVILLAASILIALWSGFRWL